MAVSYYFEESYFVLRAEGEYAPADLKQKVDEAIADLNYPGNAKFIFDVTGSKSLSERKKSDLEGMAEFLSNRGDRFNNVCAMVAQQPLHFGLLRMGAAFAEYHGMQSGVFESLEEAKAWINSN